jgi:hypothetical protein
MLPSSPLLRYKPCNVLPDDKVPGSRITLQQVCRDTARRPSGGWDDEYLRFREIPVNKLMVEKWNETIAESERLTEGFRLVAGSDFGRGGVADGYPVST